MNNLILALLVYAILLGFGFAIDTLSIPVEHKFTLMILASVVFIVLILRLSKGMSRIENAGFVTILIATLAISWTLKDIERGYITPFTLFILFILVGSFAETIYLIRKNRHKGD